MVENKDAAAAFGVLADATRIAILRAFARALEGADVGSDDPFPALAFSEVYDRVDVDSTSQLSYHLEQLDDTHLRRTDDGWTFTLAGESIVRLVLSGTYAGDVDFDPVPVDTPCPVCDAEALRVVVEDLLLFWACEDCERRMGGLPVTPAQVRGRDPEAVLSSATTRMVTRYWRFRENACPDCGGAGNRTAGIGRVRRHPRVDRGRALSAVSAFDPRTALDLARLPPRLDRVPLGPRSRRPDVRLPRTHRARHGRPMGN
ncbi:hypothetical protein C491_16997 [Natronococcus amylolyticus DSM 10524]|uniref:ArsR family transcriptional regulator n=1 Tax=Natronococcus amylolyticus DSM 10524 TaxID=1227497 RepID=L9X1T7_9EURY|nr:transcriptional regulator [Natronococcus amylolyticus]ELY55431.1 hypothetical protein C491_16997 [Natronococcus amylolyticus DSM 10524]